ncbi:MAG: NUDIX domain-containing protein [Microbacteriaceae bacterium]|nr:NUDIX domain-containing protein [Microbacteriaceae bacterium]MCL2795042.1 NUDIX domain-containing protein [Microbacteriaceae bacterium]
MEATLAVSTVIFSLRASGSFGADERERSIWLPLVRRIRAPHDGMWALPGGPLGEREGLAEAATSTLAKTTGLAPRYLEQLYAFGSPERSGEDAERVVSVVYWALVAEEEARAARIGQNVRWFKADELPRLAFDHNVIVDYALWRLRNKVEYSRIASGFLGETFTLAQLREAYEAVLGRPLDPANFRRQIEASGALVDTGQVLTGVRHRPPRLYRYNTTVDLAEQGPLGRTAEK